MPGDVLVLSEVFGPTIQGEGRHAGRPCVFVRLGRCNLDCDWCDTPYTWDWKHYDPRVELSEQTVDDTLDQVDQIATEDEIIVVSGGEPLLQAHALTLLCARSVREVHIETNGTRPPIMGAAWYSVSPKLLPSAHVDLRRAWKPKALRALADQPSAAKLVVDPAQDDEVALMEAVAALRECGFTGNRIDLMAEGATPARLTETAPQVKSLAARTGLGYSERLHVSVLGGGRGV